MNTREIITKNNEIEKMKEILEKLFNNISKDEIQNLISETLKKVLKKEWLSPQELEEEYGFTIHAQNRMRMERQIPFYKIGKYVKYKRSEIENWIEKHNEEIIKSNIKKVNTSPRGYKAPVRWDLLSNERVLLCIDKLLKGEVISQIKNNCSLSRVGNIINEIRKVIGFSAVENVYIGIGQNQGYRLIQNNEIKSKLLEIRSEIEKRLKNEK